MDSEKKYKMKNNNHIVSTVVVITTKSKRVKVQL